MDSFWRSSKSGKEKSVLPLFHQRTRDDDDDDDGDDDDVTTTTLIPDL